MWWEQPRLNEYPALLPSNIVDVVARAYALIEVGGVTGHGPERGRKFEQLFYTLCSRRRVELCERAGSRTLAQQRCASGFAHEVDGATRSVECITHWELKHLTTDLSKNELLIFNGKSLDYLYGARLSIARLPMMRFLLSGRNIGQESRAFSVLWGIMVLEPGRFPLPLLYEAVARGAFKCLTPSDQEAVKCELQWSCRPLQSVLKELSEWSNGTEGHTRCGPDAIRYTRGALDIQETIGERVIDYLADVYPEWVDEIAESTWHEVGGW